MTLQFFSNERFPQRIDIPKTAFRIISTRQGKCAPPELIHALVEAEIKRLKTIPRKTSRFARQEDRSVESTSAEGGTSQSDQHFGKIVDEKSGSVESEGSLGRAGRVIDREDELREEAGEGEDGGGKPDRQRREELFLPPPRTTRLRLLEMILRRI